MKSKIHPTYHHDTTVTCTCGNTFTTGSTKKDIQVEICSQCHPFFTGEMRFVDTMGRVEKFQQKQKKASKVKHAQKSKKQTATKKERPETLREMMIREKKRLQKTESQQATKKTSSPKVKQ